MTQAERLDYLLSCLLRERADRDSIPLPDTIPARQRLLRALMNVRPPVPADPAFLQVQDEYLQAVRTEKGGTQLSDLTPVRPGLAADAIVNAANSAMLGCFVPCHGCIDNAIHSAAGVQLRLECARIMAQQQGEEPTGRAKITKAYNLPCRYVLHTVGPIIHGMVTRRDKALLASCYRSCLELAAAYGLESIAFCCISTGEFHFPNEAAARIAIRTVEAWQREHPNGLEVIFNVFQDVDYEIYKRLLG